MVHSLVCTPSGGDQAKLEPGTSCSIRLPHGGRGPGPWINRYMTVASCMLPGIGNWNALRLNKQYIQQL